MEKNSKSVLTPDALADVSEAKEALEVNEVQGGVGAVSNLGRAAIRVRSGDEAIVAQASNPYADVRQTGETRADNW